ncbi:MAG: hypothetical protein KAX65_10170, partial [Caldilineaceae bacterium]|nr:hypothetical protein [Caldilineaceae bacterium]
MTDLASTLRIEADASGVEAGVGKARRSLAELGAAAQKTGQDAAAGIGGVGGAGQRSAQQVESATRSIVNSLQRQTAAFEAGGTSTRKYQESLARMRGVDVNALKPYLDQLDAARLKAGQAAKANTSMADSIGGATRALGAFAAAAATVGGMVAMVKRINDGVDAMNDLADATGATIENISALEDVAARTGAGFDVVSTSLIKLNQALNAAKPGSDAELAIKAIGLSVEELKALDPAEAFRQTAVALARFDDDANKARLTQILFGKSLKEVAPFLKDLAEQGALVATVTTEQAEAAEKFNKELFALQKNALDVARALTGPMVTAVNEVIKKFREGRAAGRGFFEIAADRYWENVRGFYGTDTPSTGGAEGTWDDPNQSAAETARLNRRRSVGAIPDESAAKAAADAAERAAKAAAAARKKYLDEIAKAEADALAAVQKTADARQAAYLKESNAIDAFMLSLTESASASLKSVNDRIKSLKDEQAAAELSATQNISLAEAIEQVAIARLKEKQDGFIKGSEGYVAIERELVARRELLGLVGGAEARKASKDAATAAASEWSKAADQINQSLSDALMDAFMSGKGFGKTFVDSVTSMFKTMVLKPTISAIVTGATGSLGLSGTANAATGGSSLFS